MSPTATQSTCVEESSLCLTYPDYPVHIPTTTLPRRPSCNNANLGGAGKRQKKKKKLTKRSQRDIGKKSSSSTCSSSSSFSTTSGEEAGPAKKSQGRN